MLIDPNNGDMRVVISNFNVTKSDGSTHHYMSNAELCEAFGYKEIEDPIRPDEKYYTVTESLFPPYIVSTLKPIEQLKAIRLSELSALRRSHMAKGITVNDIQVPTDETTQTKLTQAWAICQVNKKYTTNWKSTVIDPETNMPKVVFTKLTAAEIVPMFQAVSKFVGACFDAESEHFAAINEFASEEDVLSHDITTGWPE